MSLEGKTVLITGAAQRIGRALALGAATAGANVILHYRSSSELAEATAQAIANQGRQVRILQADFRDPNQTAALVPKALETGPLYALVNNASIFEALDWRASRSDWETHIQINLTTPFILAQAFAESLGNSREGRIVNLLDWRALRPGADHLPYTISKAGLAALTRSLAAGLAPRISVNGLALGAVLPPSDGGESESILKNVPAGRWAELEEVVQAMLFLLDGPSYITGEILHIDGGRHIL